MSDTQPKDTITKAMTDSVTETTFDSRAFRNALGQFCTGVTVVTMKTDGIKKDGVADAPTPVRGITVNSFSSVSLTPPLVLVCIDHRADALNFLNHSTHFGISVLAASQQDISNTFAGKPKDDQAPFDFVTIEDFPLIPNALAHFICKIDNKVEAGDHTIFVGEVVFFDSKKDDKKDDEKDGGASGESKPLLYYRGNYEVL